MLSLHSRKIREKVKQDYERIAGAFSKTRQGTWSEFLVFEPELRRRAAVASAEHRPLRVLDIGCGNGRFVDFVMSLDLGVQVDYVGIDQAQALLEEARALHAVERKGLRCRFELLDMVEVEALRADFDEVAGKRFGANAGFDAVFLIASFHHLSPADQGPFLKKLRGVLRQDALLGMTNWNLWDRRFLKAWAWNLLLWPRYGWRGLLIPWQGELDRYYFAFKLVELRRLLESAGFEILQEAVGRNFVQVARLRPFAGASFFGVWVDSVTRSQARAAVQTDALVNPPTQELGLGFGLGLGSKMPQLIFTPNPEILLEASRNESFRAALAKGALMLPDGHGLQVVEALCRVPGGRWFRRLLSPFFLVGFLLRPRWFRGTFLEVVHGSDFMAELIEEAAERDQRVFFLGAAPGVAQRAADHFKRRFPTLQVVGASAADPGEAAFQEVLTSKAQLVLVAYGAPKQELWMAEYAERLPDCLYMMGVGGSFDFYAGTVRRAPQVFRRLGLEWLWRLCLNPRQRARRIWNALVVFPWKGV